MSFCKLSGAREDSEIARVLLRKAIDFGNDLPENPKDQKGQFREGTIQFGLDSLEYALDDFGMTHSEVQRQDRWRRKESIVETTKRR